MSPAANQKYAPSETITLYYSGGGIAVPTLTGVPPSPPPSRSSRAPGSPRTPSDPLRQRPGQPETSPSAPCRKPVPGTRQDRAAEYGGHAVRPADRSGSDTDRDLIALDLGYSPTGTPSAPRRHARPPPATPTGTDPNRTRPGRLSARPPGRKICSVTVPRGAHYAYPQQPRSVSPGGDPRSAFDSPRARSVRGAQVPRPEEAGLHAACGGDCGRRGGRSARRRGWCPPWSRPLVLEAGLGSRCTTSPSRTCPGWKLAFGGWNLVSRVPGADRRRRGARHSRWH